MSNEINVFLNYLSSIINFSSCELEKLKVISKVQYIHKGDYFIKEGENVNNFAFVYEGLFRIVYLHEKGKDFTKGFFPENTFITSYSALIQSRESYFSIEALENSTIITINYNDFKKLYEKHICWHKFLILLLEKAFCKKESRERDFLLFDASTRYKNFLKEYPNLKNRIKQHHLASYLGITPVALSNIKKSFKN